MPQPGWWKITVICFLWLKMQKTNLCFLINLSKFRKQVSKVLLLLISITFEHHDTSVSFFIDGGYGSRVDQPIFWPIRTARVPNLPLWQHTKWNLVISHRKKRGFFFSVKRPPSPRRHKLKLFFQIHTPPSLAERWFSSDSGSFCCSCVYYLAQFS